MDIWIEKVDVWPEYRELDLLDQVIQSQELRCPVWQPLAT